MNGLKAAIIGAGSTYTPELIDGFIERRKSLNFEEIYLMDIDRARLDVIGGLAKRMLSAKGAGSQVVLTADLDEAIKGADYIFAQIRAGGMQSRIRDEKIPLKYGLLGQETTGAGGFMNALRTVPVMLKIARRIEKLAPGAWLINFSNPSGIIAQALNDHTKVKTIGLCNNPVNMLAGIEKALGRRDFDYDYVGINHLSWITSVILDGKEMIQDLYSGGAVSMKNIPDLDFDRELLKAVPAIPCGYLSYYYLRDEQIKKCMEAEKSRGESCMGLEAGLMEQYASQELHKKPEELSQRGGALYSTAAVSVADAIENDKNEHHVVNVVNNGSLPFLGDNDVAEVKCVVGKNGAAPVPVRAAQNEYIMGILKAVKAYERLAVKAAVNSCYTSALTALMAHPLVGDYRRAKAVLDDMLEQNREFVTLSAREGES